MRDSMKEDNMQNLNTHTIKETLKISESIQKVLINKDTHTQAHTLLMKLKLSTVNYTPILNLEATTIFKVVK